MKSYRMKQLWSSLACGIAALLLAGNVASAQTRTENGKTIVENKIEMNKMVHDFGDVTMEEKLLHCDFQVKNISDKPAVIFNVVSSCGCTNVKWTREPLLPGKTGSIHVDYTNDAGPYPFDKTLTVYISGMKKPVILRLRGIVHTKKKPLAEMYTMKMGVLGWKETEIKLGNMKQGDRKGDSFKVANLGKSPVKLTFGDVSEGLELSVSPNPIPANSVGTVEYSIEATENTLGKNYFWFTPLVNGQKAGAVVDTKTGQRGTDKVGIWSFTVKDFSGWSKEEISHAAQPIFKTSSVNIPPVRRGEKIRVKYTFTNRGKSESVFYKADCDWKDCEIHFDEKVAPGKSSEVVVEMDTTHMPEGDVMYAILITTNCPLRPYITLYLYSKIR